MRTRRQRRLRTGVGGRVATAPRMAARAVAAAAVAIAAIAAIAAMAVTAVAFAAAPLVFSFDRYNDTYTGLETVVAPIVRGPLTVRLSSPRYDLVVLANRLELEPLPGCRHRVTAWGRFSGDGELIAEVELGAFPGRFEDRVRIPEQEKEVEASVTVEIGDGGYLVTLEEVPDPVTVEIESDLVGSLVSFCRRLGRFVPGDAGCEALDRLLSNPSLPLPEPGTDFIVRRDELTAAERARFESYLAADACDPPLAAAPSRPRTAARPGD